MIRSARHFLVAAAWTGALAAAGAEPAPPSVADLLPSAWVVTVERDARPRSLRVDSVQSRSNGAAQLAARFGPAEGDGRPVMADLVSNDHVRQLSLTTPAETRIVVREVAPGIFKGSFTPVGGRSKDVTLTRVEAPTAAATATPTTAATAAAAAVVSDAPPAAPVAASGAPVARSGDAPRARDVLFVWMGGNDCPPCRAWRGVELPKLQSSEEFRHVRFAFVTKTIGQGVPPAMFLPDAVKPYKAILDAASAGGPGSPQAAIVVDGQVYDYFYGTRSAQDLEKMLHAIRTGSPYPHRRCERMSNWGRGCERYAPG